MAFEGIARLILLLRAIPLATRPKNEKILTFKVPTEVFRDFQSFCSEKQLTQADGLRLILRLVSAEQFKFENVRKSALVCDLKTSVALTQTELDLLDRIARQYTLRRGAVLRILVTNFRSIISR